MGISSSSSSSKINNTDLAVLGVASVVQMNEQKPMATHNH